MKDYRTERTKEILNQIRESIKKKGYKKKFVAEKVGLNERQFCDLLCGRRVFSVDVLLGLAELLNINGDIRRFSTAELVAEFNTRVGVEKITAEPYEDEIVKVNGPAVILVVKD